MEKVYIVKTCGNWDGEFEDTHVFKDEQVARDFFLQEVADQRHMYLENYTEGPDDFFFEDDTKFYGDSRLVIEKSHDCCEIFIDGEYCTYHCVISIQAHEVL